MYRLQWAFEALYSEIVGVSAGRRHLHLFGSCGTVDRPATLHLALCTSKGGFVQRRDTWGAGEDQIILARANTW